MGIANVSKSAYDIVTPIRNDYKSSTAINEAQIGMSHVAHMDESCRLCERVIAHANQVCNTLVTHLQRFPLINGYLPTHIRSSHATHISHFRNNFYTSTFLFYRSFPLQHQYDIFLMHICLNYAWIWLLKHVQN